MSDGSWFNTLRGRIYTGLVRELIVRYVGILGDIMLQLALFPQLGNNPSFWCKTMAEGCECGDTCDWNTTGDPDFVGICWNGHTAEEDSSGKCRWNDIVLQCARNGYSELLRYLINSYPRIHTRHRSGMLFWEVAALNNRVNMITEFKGDFTRGDDGGWLEDPDDAPVIGGVGYWKHFFWYYHDTTTLNEVIGQSYNDENTDAIIRLIELGAVYDSYDFDWALCNNNVALAKYIERHFKMCWCGQRAQYALCATHGGESVRDTPCAVPWSEDIFTRVFCTANIRVAEGLWTVGKIVRQGELPYLFEWCSHAGLSKMVHWALYRGFSIRDSKYAYLYRKAFGQRKFIYGSVSDNGPRTISINWVYEHSPDLKLVKELHTHGCPVPPDMTCTDAVHSIELIELARNTLGLDWSVNTALAAANSGYYDVLKFLIENGCPANSTVADIVFNDKHNRAENWSVLGWLIDHGIKPTDSSEPLVKRRK